MATHSPRLKRALISVSDKAGLQELAAALTAADVEIYSTGGTGHYLSTAGFAVHDIADYTGFPEMMDGRLKTLHPRIFGGILGRHDRADDRAGLQDHGIVTFELVVVNLYPFESTIARTGVTDEEAIEQIDIGGPSLVRAAAKNYAFVAVATSPDQYPEIITQVARGGCITAVTRRSLAAAAFARTAAYDAAIAGYFARGSEAESNESPEFPEELIGRWQRQATLRYGENPHQRAAVYCDQNRTTPSLLSAQQLHGKELSYNNYLDLDAAWRIVHGLVDPAVAVIKHNNPCGVACADSLAAATQAALAGDPVSAFGSILGCNRTVDEDTAEVLIQPGLFIESIVAPDFSPAALALLTSKPKWKLNVRLMRLGEMPPPIVRSALRPIDGGVLLQDADTLPPNTSEWTVVTRTQPTDALWSELVFAWQMVRHVTSNAIVLTRDRSLVGAGAGQMSRVDAVEIAIRKASDRARQRAGVRRLLPVSRFH